MQAIDSSAITAVRMRRASAVDANHTQIVAAFRKLGCTVLSLAAVGKGCPDLCVAYRKQNHLVEVKDGEKVPSARTLTPDQKVFHAIWGTPVEIVESIDDVVKCLRMWGES